MYKKKNSHNLIGVSDELGITLNVPKRKCKHHMFLVHAWGECDTSG